MLGAYGLPPMDMNGSADSYPEIKLGLNSPIKDLGSKVDTNLNPNYFASYDMTCTIPGAATLTVGIWEHDSLGMDDHIGSTSIDIEDRIFNPEWRAYTLKPVERRTLKLPTSSLSQGKVELWVDILTPAEAKELPMPDIKPAPADEFELRVCVWETRYICANKSTDMQCAVNFIGYESIQSQSGIGGHNNRWDYAQAWHCMAG